MRRLSVYRAQQKKRRSAFSETTTLSLSAIVKQACVEVKPERSQNKRKSHKTKLPFAKT